jgi:RNA-binding protein 25
MSTPSAPGVAPPGVQYNGPPQLGAPRVPSNFQPPAGMPNINFNAPVIRLGTTGGQRGSGMDGGRRESAAPGRRGLGMDGPDAGRREEQKMLARAPTREEIARTIFVGNIPDGVGGDDGVEAILNTAGGLANFFRATDANNKPQTFGFAEYSDAQSLRTATEIFKDLRVPTKRQKPGPKEDGKEVETTTLQVMVDDASVKYAEEWTKNEDEATVQFRIDSAKESLAQVIARMFNPPNMPPMDYGLDTAMRDAPPQDSDNVPVLNIDITAGEDELADIPVEMREIVAAEITAFRDRSIKRDQERLRREEEIEAEQRRRDRRASPPASTPTAPNGGGANGIPLGPRADRGVQGAPSGPKGSQFPRDYQGGVNFINGGAISNGVYIDRDNDDDSASDSELEQRRKKKQDAELDDIYKKQLTRWLKHEHRNVSSLERTHHLMKNNEAEQKAARDAQAAQLKNFDDDAEASGKRHMYYRDHGEYMRERQKAREREEKDDHIDREQENRELAVQQRQKDHARDEADAFLDQQAEEMLQAQVPREPHQFKMSLGAATKKLEQTAAPRRTAADVENLLEDEEIIDQTGTKKRTLIPISFDAAVRANLTPEEVAEAQKQLARDIPNDKEGLWNWPISWQHVLDKHLDKDIKDWAAEKVLQTLGLQEDLVVDAIIEHLRNRGDPTELVENLQDVCIHVPLRSYCGIPC